MREANGQEASRTSSPIRAARFQQGVELVNKTGSALDEIAAAIKEVAELVSDIAGAAWSNRTASIRSTRR
jgi:methyl-accepting chemotaxis protein